MNKKRGIAARRRSIALISGAIGLLSTVWSNAQEVSFSASQTIGNSTADDVTIDASTNVVDITQNPGTTLELAIGGLTKFGGFAASIGGGSIIADSGEIDVDSSGGDFAINSSLNGSSLVLLKLGTGRTILGSTDAINNTFAGGIYINAGAVQISSDANLGANAGNSNSITLSGGTLEVAGNINFSSSHAIFVDTSGGTIAVTNSGFVATIDDTNQLSGPGTLVKEGPGLMRISSANIIGGSVVINSGILELQHTSALCGTRLDEGTHHVECWAQLNLRHDGPFPANFGNDITVGGNSIIDVNQIALGSTGNIQLGALNIGNATLTVSGANRTLEFTGTTTVTGNSTIDNSVDVRLGGALTGNGSLTKRGAGLLALSGFAPNTFADVTQVLGGTLELGKDPGTNAVPGDLIINGGTVRLVTPGQIADNANVTLTTGSLELNNQTDTVSVLHNDGGVFTTGTGALLVTSPNTTVLASGTTILNGGSLSSTSVLVTGGFNEVQANGVLSVGTNGLVMQMANSPAINLDSHNTTPGLMVLQSNASITGTSGTAGLLNLGSNALRGKLDLSGGMRTFTIDNGSAAVDMLITARVTGGGITKAGTGTLRLTASNDYTGGTVISDGTLEITDGAGLGGGSVLLQGGVLALRTDASTTFFSAPVSAAPANSIALDIGPINSGSAGTFQVPSATLGSALTVTGNGGGTLAISGPVNLQASVNVAANTAVAFNGVIAQVGSGTFGITKTGTATLTIGGTGNNNYLGSTTINSGVLQLAKTSGTALPTNVMINGPGSLRLAGSEQISDSATVIMNSAVGVAVFDLGNQSETIGALTGNGSVLLGSGQLTIAAASSSTFNGTVSGSGHLNKNGAAEFILAGANNFTGGSAVSGGTLTYSTISASESGNVLTSGVWRVSAGATLNFAAGANITNNQASVTLDGVGSSFARFDSIAVNSGTFSLTDGRVFTTSGGFNNSGTISVGGGIAGSSLIITGPVAQMSGSTLTGGNWIVLAGGALFFNSGTDVLTNAANVTLSGSGSTFSRINNLANNQGRFSVTGGQRFVTAGALSNSGTVTIGSGSVIKVNAALTNTGTVDISGGLAVDYTGSSPFNTIKTQIASGYAGGLWNGPGLNSSAAALIAADPSNPHKTTLACAEASAIGIAGSGSFLGQTVDDTSVLVRYTTFGDANLDGAVNSADFTRLALHFGQSGAAWTDGDYTGDGIVNALDFNQLATNYGQAVASSPIELSSLGSVVPEPMSGASLFLLFGVCACRRHRQI